MPRRDYYDDDDDDRPRTRSRRRYEDDDDDYDPRPRRKSTSSNSVPIIIGVVVGVLFLIVLGVAGAIFAFRGRPAQQPPPQFVVNNPQPQMVNMNPMGPGPPGGPRMPVAAPEMPNFPNVPPGGPPAMPNGPGGPAVGGNQVTISNLKLGRFGARKSLEFDYNFTGGRPIGADYVAVVTEPGQREPGIARLHVLFDQRGTITVDSFGGLGRGFAPGTTVYLGKQFIGARGGVPTPISNTLTLQ